jgi:Ni,Fe-hydrogenase III component G
MTSEVSDMQYNEEDIVRLLSERFDGITVSIQRERRIWLSSPREGFLELLAYIHDELGFVSLCTVTGLDAGEEFELIYHLSHDGGGIVISARVSAPCSDPVFETATDIYRGGMLYELEARNLLGLTILGLPDDIRYPLPDNWPEGEYPLRKEWVVPEGDVEDTAEADAVGAVASEADGAATDTAPATSEEENNG